MYVFPENYEAHDSGESASSLLLGVELSSPPSRFGKVLFPAPEGPRITTNYPLSGVKLIPSSSRSSCSPLR